MCGISALVGPGASDEVEAMTDLIIHRGPDGVGYASFCNGEVALGHRRLAIVDLSPTGHQPMASSCGRYSLTYNGEIYNAPELREELQKRGYSFKGHSDTEVLLYACIEWGNEALKQLNGMFAFVFFDEKKRKLLVARDRFGIKPLYYWNRGEGRFAFASEIKQFTALSGWKAKANRQRAYDFLVWGASDHTEETFFEGVKQLPGGHLLELSLGGGLRQELWYRLPDAHYAGDFEQAAERFRELLKESISLRLRADVEVGSCLSGGLDSSAIVCLANQELRGANGEVSQATFSACSHDPRYDEREYIDEVVQQTALSPYYIYPEFERLQDLLSDLIWHQDEPFQSTSIFAQWEVFRLAREQKVKVMLDGQGADEQLAGYSSFLPRRARELLLQPHQLLREVKGRQWLQLVDLLLPEFARQSLRRRMGKEASKPSWLSLVGVKDEDPFLREKGSSVTGYCRLQIERSHLPKLLHWEDRDSMAHSVEARTPFLDYRLVEFVHSLPSDFKLGGGVAKRVLREGVKRDLPSKILGRRDKMGFVTPEESWLRKPLGGRFFTRGIHQAVEASSGFVQPEATRLIDEIVAGKRAFSSLPWRLVAFGCWLDRFSVEVP